jgi:hypothetical protein
MSKNKYRHKKLQKKGKRKYQKLRKFLKLMNKSITHKNKKISKNKVYLKNKNKKRSKKIRPKQW